MSVSAEPCLARSKALGGDSEEDREEAVAPDWKEDEGEEEEDNEEEEEGDPCERSGGRGHYRDPETPKRCLHCGERLKDKEDTD